MNKLQILLGMKRKAFNHGLYIFDNYCWFKKKKTTKPKINKKNKKRYVLPII